MLSMAFAIAWLANSTEWQTLNCHLDQSIIHDEGARACLLSKLDQIAVSFAIFAEIVYGQRLTASCNEIDSFLGIWVADQW